MRRIMAGIDTDNDGIPDVQDLDDDNDGLSDIDETARGTNPLKFDTDGDGVSDGDEVAAGTDPLDNTSFPVTADGDLNVDGVVNAADVLLAQRIIPGKLPLTQQYLDHGDVAPLVNGAPAPSGQFNLGDLLVIQRKAVDLISSF
jgi:hypothetical protein